MLTQRALMALTVAHLNLRGNASGRRCARPRTGPVTGLYPINPLRVSVAMRQGQPVYTIVPGDGSMLQGEFGRAT
jgi:hypothetical protein